MESDLFAQANLEKQTDERFVLQNPQMLRVSLGADVLALKGAMVAYQGSVTFNHESAGSVGRMLKKAVSGDEAPLMRVSGQGDVFFANNGGFVFLVQLRDEALSVSGHNLLAFDSSLSWDIRRQKGANVMTGGLFNMELSGTGTVALHALGQPVVLDCTQQSTSVDVTAAVAWTAGLKPTLTNSMNMRSMLRGGSSDGSAGGKGLLGDLFG